MSHSADRPQTVLPAARRQDPSTWRTCRT